MVTKSTGVITTVAGNGTIDYSGDGGLAVLAQLNLPYGIAVDTSGNIYISDTWSSIIRTVTKSNGIITTVAGTGTPGNTGDGGLPTSARLLFPYGIAVDSLGNIFSVDTYNHAIRMISTSTGIITTVAGTVGTFG